MVCPVMVGADEDQILQFGKAAVFPMNDVMRVQTAGGAAAGDHAAVVAVLQRAT